MSTHVPAIPRPEFEARLQREAPRELSTRALSALWIHFEELRKWSRSMALIGPGTAAEICSRHYGEALAGLELLESTPAGSMVVDVGSGAGFPGFVIAAARPDLKVALVETRERKWAFLRQASRKATLPCLCLNVRVAEPLPAELPEKIQVLTMRAIRLPGPVLAALGRRLEPAAKLLAWQSDLDQPEAATMEPPSGFELGRKLRLPESQRRFIVEYLVQAPR